MMSEHYNELCAGGSMLRLSWMAKLGSSFDVFILGHTSGHGVGTKGGLFAYSRCIKHE